MKTLYISDLDGTLLNHQGILSPKTIHIVNQFIDQGGYFSVATARSQRSAHPLLKPLHLNLPILLMNGVCIYNPLKQAYNHVHFLTPDALNDLVDALHQLNLSGFLFTLEQEELHCYYERLEPHYTEEFIQERRLKYNNRFIQVSDFSKLPLDRVIYFSVNSPKELLQPLYHKLSTHPAFHLEFYHNVYQPSLFYLEIFSHQASKYYGVLNLKNHYGFDRVIGFGDNLNDLPLFRACDEAYAVNNAHTDLKKMSTDILDDHTTDPVARFLWSKCMISPSI